MVTILKIKKTKTPIISSPFGLIRYAASNYTKNLEDRKSIMRYCYFINRMLISGWSKKQRTIPIFIIKAKYITLRHLV